MGGVEYQHSITDEMSADLYNFCFGLIITLEEE